MPATQVGLRPLESGLGGREKGVCGVNDGVDGTSTPLWNWMRGSWTDRTTLSDFTDVNTEFIGDSRNGKSVLGQHRLVLLDSDHDSDPLTHAKRNRNELFQAIDHLF